MVWPYSMMASAAFRNATGIIAVTPQYLRWAIARVGGERKCRSIVIPFGYDARPPTSDQLTKSREMWCAHGLSGAPAENVCFFGTFGRQFDIGTIVRAARIIHQCNRSVRFVICGRGDQEAALRKLAEGAENVIFPGWVCKSDIAVLMGMCFAGLAPYRNTAAMKGNIPNKIIEYLSAGLPVLSCLKGEVSRLIETERIGIVYEDGNAASLANAVMELLDARRMRDEMASRAKSLFLREYDDAVVSKRFVNYILDSEKCGKGGV
jgi:glycosyltransferase involved in cell wall biosynthesis